MKKKLALMMLLTLVISLVSTSFAFAGFDNLPWSTEPPTTETIVVE